jgi:hypothetical protein
MDKVIVSHRGALREKYSDPGFDRIKFAVDELIAADANRGLQTELILIDDTAAMQKLGGKPSTRKGPAAPDSPDSTHQQEAKEAVDTIASRRSTAYLMLLDGPDVIPHIVLDNPAFRIKELEPTERTIASDLPYASSARFSRNVADYLSIMRAVGRVPNVPGSDDPSTITQYLKRAAAAEPRPVSDYQNFFALSAQEFKNSTGQTIAELEPTGEIDIVPPAGPPATDARFARLSHFINCHGLKDKAEFFSGADEQLVVAMNSSQVAEHVVDGTVVAAECCYGAQLYDPRLAKAEVPICISYIAKGALGFFGSTNNAFGGIGAKPNGGADLITRFFFENVLSGSSLGKAVAEARQRFINTQRMDGGNLKTLAQFILLGDPSVIPCKLTATLRDDSELKDKSWTVRLADDGQRTAEGAVVTTEGPVSVPETVKQNVRAIAQENGYGETEETLLPISLWTSRDSGSNKAGEFVMVIRPRSQTRNRNRYLVAHIVGEDIVQVDEAESRLGSQK